MTGITPSESGSPQPARPAAPTPSEEPQVAGTDEPPRGRLLVVDPDPAARETISAALAAFGYSVVHTERAHDALQALEREPFDAVVAEIRLPGPSGLELLEALEVSWPGIPAVLLSAEAGIEEVLAGMARRAAGFLSKPCRPSDLLWLIERARRGSPRAA